MKNVFTDFYNIDTRTRNTVERAFGVIKKRFYALSTGLRVKKMDEAAKIVVCAFILHNLAIQFGDNGDDFIEDDDQPESPADGGDQLEEGDNAADTRERRRNQLLNFFQRN